MDSLHTLRGDHTAALETRLRADEGDLKQRQDLEKTQAELEKTQAELAKTQEELQRIKRRLSAPRP